MHGIYVYDCSCGWKMLRKTDPGRGTVRCEACGLEKMTGGESAWRFDDQVACQVANLVEIQSARVRDEADKHDFTLLKTGKTKYRVLKKSTPMTVTFKDETCACYWEVEEVFAGTWQECMNYIYQYAPKAPNYLRNKEKS